MTRQRPPSRPDIFAHCCKVAGVGEGPLFCLADAVLSDSTDYGGFRAGTATRADFARAVEARRIRLVEAGASALDVDFIKRFPPAPGAFVAAALRDLEAAGLRGRGSYDVPILAAAARRLGLYRHAGRRTYIAPEEAELLLALVAVARPRRVLFLGSYYGFWAASAVPALAAANSTAFLVDPDPECCALAADNLAPELERGLVEIACETGEQWLASCRARFDMLVLDAELPQDHPSPALRGKGVYASLLEAALPRLAPGALLVSHNILLRCDPVLTPRLQEAVERNRAELAPFRALAEAHCAWWCELESTEGVGVGALR